MSLKIIDQTERIIQELQDSLQNSKPAQQINILTELSFYRQKLNKLLNGNESHCMNKIEYLNLEISNFTKIKSINGNKINCYLESGQHLLHSEENTDTIRLLNTLIDFQITFASNIKSNIDKNNSESLNLLNLLKEIKFKTIINNLDNIRNGLDELNSEIKNIGILIKKEKPTEISTLNQEINRIKTTQKQLEEVIIEVRKIVSS